MLVLIGAFNRLKQFFLRHFFNSFRVFMKLFRGMNQLVYSIQEEKVILFKKVTYRKARWYVAILYLPLKHLFNIPYK